MHPITLCIINFQFTNYDSRQAGRHIDSTIIKSRTRSNNERSSLNSWRVMMLLFLEISPPTRNFQNVGALAANVFYKYHPKFVISVLFTDRRFLWELVSKSLLCFWVTPQPKTRFIEELSIDGIAFFEWFEFLVHRWK